MVYLLHCAYMYVFCVCRVVVLRDQIRETQTRKGAKRHLELGASQAKRVA